MATLPPPTTTTSPVELGCLLAGDVVVNLEQEADARLVARHVRVLALDAEHGALLAAQRQEHRAIAAREQVVDGQSRPSAWLNRMRPPSVVMTSDFRRSTSFGSR